MAWLKGAGMTMVAAAEIADDSVSTGRRRSAPTAVAAPTAATLPWGCRTSFSKVKVLAIRPATS
jgi:hypothetical protein